MICNFNARSYARIVCSVRTHSSISMRMPSLA